MIFSPHLEALGWTLLHSCWQGAVLALLYAGARYLLRTQGPQMRYALALSTLLLLPLTAGLTLAWHWPETSTTAVAVAAAEPIDLSGLLDGAGETEAEAVPAAPTIETEMTWRERLAAWVPYLPWAWLLGVALMSLRWGTGLWQLQRLRTQGVAPGPKHWQHQLDRWSQGWGLRRRVRLLVSERIGSPATLGFFKPVILMPASLLTGLSPAQWEAILLHELAHIRRADYAIRMIQSLIEILFFYHPLVWWVGKDLAHEREACCDDQAVAACGDALRYAQALTTLQRMCQPSKTNLAMSIQSKQPSFTRRIQRLFEPTQASSRPKAGILLALLLTVSLASYGWINLGSNAIKADEQPPAFELTEDRLVMTIDHSWTRDYLTQTISTLATQGINFEPNLQEFDEQGRLSRLRGSIAFPDGRGEVFNLNLTHGLTIDWEANHHFTWRGACSASGQTQYFLYRPTVDSLDKLWKIYEEIRPCGYYVSGTKKPHRDPATGDLVGGISLYYRLPQDQGPTWFTTLSANEDEAILFKIEGDQLEVSVFPFAYVDSFLQPEKEEAFPQARPMQPPIETEPGDQKEGNESDAFPSLRERKNQEFELPPNAYRSLPPLPPASLPTQAPHLRPAATAERSQAVTGLYQDFSLTIDGTWTRNRLEQAVAELGERGIDFDVQVTQVNSAGTLTGLGATVRFPGEKMQGFAAVLGNVTIQGNRSEGYQLTVNSIHEPQDLNLIIDNDWTAKQLIEAAGIYLQKGLLLVPGDFSVDKDGHLRSLKGKAFFADGSSNSFTNESLGTIELFYRVEAQPGEAKCGVNLRPGLRLKEFWQERSQSAPTAKHEHDWRFTLGPANTREQFEQIVQALSNDGYRVEIEALDLTDEDQLRYTRGRITDAGGLDLAFEHTADSYILIELESNKGFLKLSQRGTTTYPLGKGPGQMPLTGTIHGMPDGNPVYLLDGEVVPRKALKALDPRDIGSIDVLKGKAAESLDLEQDASEGVIVITTKQALAEQKLAEVQADSSLKKMLLVLNGQVIDGDNFSAIPSEEIVGIELLKGQAALDRFGARGNRGALLLETRDPVQDYIEQLNLRVSPNPSPDLFAIDFELPKSGPLRIEVYDQYGRLAEELFSGRVEAGSHRYFWRGSDYAAGLYFIRVKGKQAMGQQRVQLVK